VNVEALLFNTASEYTRWRHPQDLLTLIQLHNIHKFTISLSFENYFSVSAAGDLHISDYVARHQPFCEELASQAIKLGFHNNCPL